MVLVIIKKYRFLYSAKELIGKERENNGKREEDMRKNKKSDRKGRQVFPA